MTDETPDVQLDEAELDKAATDLDLGGDLIPEDESDNNDVAHDDGEDILPEGTSAERPESGRVPDAPPES